MCVCYFVHSPYEVIHTTTTAPLLLPEKAELEINYRMQETRPAASLRRLSVSQRQCRFFDEPTIPEIPVYATSTCHIMCRYRHALKVCGCKPFFYHILAGKTCNVAGMVCLAKHAEFFTQNSNKMGCNCVEPCRVITYFPQAFKMTEWVSGYFDQRVTFRWGLLHPTTRFHRDVLFGFEDLVDLLKSVFLLWIYFFGFWSLASELLYSSLYSVISLLVLFVSFLYLRIPPPKKTAVDAVIGKDPLYEEGSDNGNFVMRVVAHRGAGLDAPENSLIAFKMCAEKTCFGVEFDVTLTADNVPVIFHDNTLERMTDIPSEIRKLTWNELSKVDISVKHPLKEKFIGTNIPTLDATVQQCLNSKQKIFIDIKDDDKRIVKIILELFDKYPTLEANAVCTSFYPRVIYRIRSINPKIVCALAYRPHFFAYQSFSLSGKGLPRSKNVLKHFLLKNLDIFYTWALPQIVYYIVGISAILLHKDYISGKILNDWRDRGVRVIAWTVNHPIEKQHFSRNLKITYMTDTLIGESSAHRA